jgi:hypothetical protein
MLVALTWAPSVAESHCTEELLARNRCAVSAFSGASGLLLFLLPLGVGSAYLWREGTLRPPAQDQEEEADVAQPADDDGEDEEPSEPIARLRSRIDGERAGVDKALDAAATRLRGKQVAVVMSGRLSREVNERAVQLAELLDAQKFLMSTEGPHAQAVRELAPGLTHVDELALLLAGGFLQGVVLVDAQAEFHELTLAGLGRLASVALAEALTPSAEASAVLLAASGEDGASLGGRPRVELLDGLISRLRPEGDEAEAHENEDESGSGAGDLFKTTEE